MTVPKGKNRQPPVFCSYSLDRQKKKANHLGWLKSERTNCFTNSLPRFLPINSGHRWAQRLQGVSISSRPVILLEKRKANVEHYSKLGMKPKAPNLSSFNFMEELHFWNWFGFLLSAVPKYVQKTHTSIINPQKTVAFSGCQEAIEWNVVSKRSSVKATGQKQQPRTGERGESWWAFQDVGFWWQRNHRTVAPRKFNSSPLKNGGWKTTFLLGR